MLILIRCFCLGVHFSPDHDILKSPALQNAVHPLSLACVRKAESCCGLFQKEARFGSAECIAQVCSSVKAPIG